MIFPRANASASRVSFVAVAFPCQATSRSYGRGTTADYLRFLRTARGSLGEIETQLIIAEALGMGDQSSLTQGQDRAVECRRILGGLINAIESSERQEDGEPSA
jgi:hypothetical protein